MNAFISYSVNDESQYLISLLSFKLRDNDLITSTNVTSLNDILDFTTQSYIRRSHLFIGIITDDGLERERVIKEWQFAVERDIPNILLIEDTVPDEIQFQGNIIRFNRHNPENAMKQIEEKREIKPSTKNNISEALPWLLGGVAIIAFFTWLLSKSKQEASVSS